jgi:hypothetical protein
MTMCLNPETPGAATFFIWMAFTISIRSIHVQDCLVNADKIVVMENLLYLILVILGFVAVALYFSINRDLDD